MLGSAKCGYYSGSTAVTKLAKLLAISWPWGISLCHRRVLRESGPGGLAQAAQKWDIFWSRPALETSLWYVNVSGQINIPKPELSFHRAKFKPKPCWSATKLNHPYRGESYLSVAYSLL